MRMRHELHGYHMPANNVEHAEMVKAGWVEVTDEQWAAILAAKRGDPPTQQVQQDEPPSGGFSLPPKRGRPKKA